MFEESQAFFAQAAGLDMVSSRGCNAGEPVEGSRNELRSSHLSRDGERLLKSSGCPFTILLPEVQLSALVLCLADQPAVSGLNGNLQALPQVCFRSYILPTDTFQFTQIL